jgi:hypothetical protein
MIIMPAVRNGFKIVVVLLFLLFNGIIVCTYEPYNELIGPR